MLTLNYKAYTAIIFLKYLLYVYIYKLVTNEFYITILLKRGIFYEKKKNSKADNYSTYSYILN